MSEHNGSEGGVGSGEVVEAYLRYLDVCDAFCKAGTSVGTGVYTFSQWLGPGLASSGVGFVGSCDGGFCGRSIVSNGHAGQWFGSGQCTGASVGSSSVGEVITTSVVDDIGTSVGSVGADLQQKFSVSEPRCSDGAASVSLGRSVGEGLDRGLIGVEVKEKGKNWKKNLARRLKKKRGDNGIASSGGSTVPSAFVGDKKSELASSFDDRRIAENRLATQKAEYQLKKNEYMTRSRVAEQQWETERLTCDQKLQKITEARFGTKPGFAETLVSANISSTSLPSMSQGTLSPDSSISVAEVNKMFKLIADLTAQVAQLTVESKAMKETAVLSAYEQRKLEMENMTFEQIAALRGTEKDIRPDGSPVKYDAIGQEIYSECGRPDFMNQYDYRSSITVSEDGQ